MRTAAHNDIFEGSVLSGPYPFVRDKYSYQDESGWCEEMVWKPGVRMEPCGPEDAEAIADGEGKIILTVVATFKPGRFPARVFYTRAWLPPSGKSFGKNKLRVTTLQNFYALAKGYRHDYRLSSLDSATPESDR